MAAFGHSPQGMQGNAADRVRTSDGLFSRSAPWHRHLPRWRRRRPPIIGFYTTRIVRAASQEEAAKATAHSVTEQWSTDPGYSKNNRGTLPTLSVEWVRNDTFFGSLFFRGVGHTFYPAEPSA